MAASQRVYIHDTITAADTNTFLARERLDTVPGLDAAAALLEARWGPVDDIGHIDLYGCFPSIVHYTAATLGLVPLVIETGPDAAERLAASVQQAPIPRGVAIPAGGAAAFHPDGSLEPLASTLEEIVSEEDGGLRRAHLLPSAAGGGDERPVH